MKKRYSIGSTQIKQVQRDIYHILSYAKGKVATEWLPHRRDLRRLRPGNLLPKIPKKSQLVCTKNELSFWSCRFALLQSGKPIRYSSWCGFTSALMYYCTILSLHYSTALILKPTSLRDSSNNRNLFVCISRSIRVRSMVKINLLRRAGGSTSFLYLLYSHYLHSAKRNLPIAQFLPDFVWYVPFDLPNLLAST